jgi:hypothetical protein
MYTLMPSMLISCCCCCRCCCLSSQLVCPVAKPLAQQQPLVLHFASSSDMYTLMPQGGSRIQAPAGLCEGPGITWMARIGSMTYGALLCFAPREHAMFHGIWYPMWFWWTADSVSLRAVTLGPSQSALLVTSSSHSHLLQHTQHGKNCSQANATAGCYRS